MAKQIVPRRLTSAKRLQPRKALSAVRPLDANSAPPKGGVENPNRLNGLPVPPMGKVSRALWPRRG